MSSRHRFQKSTTLLGVIGPNIMGVYIEQFNLRKFQVLLEIKESDQLIYFSLKKLHIFKNYSDYFTFGQIFSGIVPNLRLFLQITFFTINVFVVFQSSKNMFSRKISKFHIMNLNWKLFDL
jgi:hypothetical protein